MQHRYRYKLEEVKRPVNMFDHTKINFALSQNDQTQNILTDSITSIGHNSTARKSCQFFFKNPHGNVPLHQVPSHILTFVLTKGYAGTKMWGTILVRSYIQKELQTLCIISVLYNIIFSDAADSHCLALCSH